MLAILKVNLSDYQPVKNLPNIRHETGYSGDCIDTLFCFYSCIAS